MQPILCEIFLACNESGDWIVCSDKAVARGELMTSFGGNLARVVKITVKMTPPVMAEATVTVPDDAGTVEAVAS